MVNQIPPEPVHFVGREAERARVARAAAEWNGRYRPLCVALSGPAGLGKTELGFSIARTDQGRYPDGIVHLDLDDLRRNGAFEPADAVGVLLMELGVSAEWLRPLFKDRCKHLVEFTNGKRQLVFLDNARYRDEIVQLLPASGTSLFIVTSQGRLDLADSGAVDLPLPPLAPAESAELLRQLIGDTRADAEPQAFEGLIALCSGLPEALHVAGRLIRRHHRRPLGRMLAELTEELTAKGLPMTEGLWDAAYSELSDDAALLYRLLPVHPGPTFTPHSAVALLGLGQQAGSDALEMLEQAGLVDARGGGLRLLGLLRAHARRRTGQDGEAEAAGLRIVRWLLRQAQSADALAAGRRMVLATMVPPISDAPDLPLQDAVAAYRWLDDERHALQGAAELAYAMGWDEEVGGLCEAVWTRFLDRPHYADDLDAFGLGVAAAQRSGAVALLVRMRCLLARALWDQERYAEAAAALDDALGSVAALGRSDRERKVVASYQEFRGRLELARGRLAAAEPFFEASLLVHRELGNDYGVMLQTYHLGQVAAGLDRPEQAAALLTQAHAAAGALGRERMTARTAHALGGVLRTLGRTDEARSLFEAALTAADARGGERDQVRALDALGVLEEDAGNAEAAGRHREAARVIRERNGVVG